MQLRVDPTWRHPSWWSLLIFLPWVLGSTVAIRGLVEDRTIAQREKTTTGTVTAHEPANHNRYGYSFTVDGRTYSGWSSLSRSRPRIGQQIAVFYDPLDPTKNSLIHFADLDRVTPSMIAATLLGMALFALLIWYRRRVQRPMPQTTVEPQ